MHVQLSLHVSLPCCVSNFSTLSSPSSPPQAMYPCSRFQARHLSLTLFGIAILQERYNFVVNIRKIKEGLEKNSP